MAIPIPFIGGLLGKVTGFLGNRQEAKIEAEKAASEERRDGWKDEYALVILSLPYLAAFVPAAQPFIKIGFETLASSTPEWYQDLFKWGMASALGIVSIKKLFKG